MSPSTAQPRFGVGVGVFVLHPSDDQENRPADGVGSSEQPSERQYRFLLGQRIGSLGASTWGLPGGHLEHGESFEECAAREVAEETGLEVEKLRFLTATHDFFAAQSRSDDGPEKQQEKGQYYVTIFMTATVKAKNDQPASRAMPEAQLLEPNKCAGWDWISWPELVAYARPQLHALEGDQGAAVDGDAVQVEASDATGQTETASRTLFSPLISLLTQRPEAVPSL
jgi:8-oxo-dGTP diphosphatase